MFLIVLAFFLLCRHIDRIGEFVTTENLASPCVSECDDDHCVHDDRVDFWAFVLDIVLQYSHTIASFTIRHHHRAALFLVCVSYLFAPCGPLPHVFCSPYLARCHSCRSLQVLGTLEIVCKMHTISTRFPECTLLLCLGEVHPPPLLVAAALSTRE